MNDDIIHGGAEIADALGITVRTLNNWIRRGLVRVDKSIAGHISMTRKNVERAIATMTRSTRGRRKAKA